MRMPGRGRPVRNLVRTVVTSFPGDPRGESLVGPLMADTGRVLSGRAGTTIYGATNASSGNEFSGWVNSPQRVPVTPAGGGVYWRNQPAEFHSSVSDQASAYRAILAARLTRNAAAGR